MKTELTQARLKELLHYDPETGHFTRRVPRGGMVVGSRAGKLNTSGHRQIRIDRRMYLAHRLAFLYMLGSFPTDCVDHINQVKDDNRWGNLRPATRQQNQGNKGLQRNNSSGHRGVSWDKRQGKWVAQGGRSGGRIHLGRFDSLEEAAAAARSWRTQTYGEFAT
jgi:hypothetical protein